MGVHGSVMIATLAVMLLLISLVGGFLFAAGTFSLHSGWEETDAQALWLAEAGLHKAAWNLRTPASGGGQGETWTTAGTTETLGAGSYTMVVTAWDFALATNSGTATAKSSSSGHPASDAIDNSTATYWESANNVRNTGASNEEWVQVQFPYTLTINKARFIVPSGSNPNRPQEYDWEASTDGSTFTTITGGTLGSDGDVTGNTCNDRTDTFPPVTGVNYLRLNVTRTNTNNRQARIATLEVAGQKITSTGTVASGGQTVTRTVVQTVVSRDGATALSACASSPLAVSASVSVEPDWVE